ncbi:MAG: sodium:calcium antiporter, partial [Symploca sp. SIO1C4]|nr:sodium:calcium antiporter [Symploca sp. SIO1C4]
MDTVTLLLFLSGFVLLVVGADILVQGACGLAIAAGVSQLVIGLTIVAY